MAVVNRLASHRRPALVLFAVMAVFAVSAALIGLSGSLPSAVAFVTLAGAATLVAEVIAVTLLQRAAPDDVGPGCSACTTSPTWAPSRSGRWLPGHWPISWVRAPRS
jgi:predicted MFS family arabinose efflux permease